MRRTDDISAYFDLAPRRRERRRPTCAAKSTPCANWWTGSKPKPCSPATTTPATPSSPFIPAPGGTESQDWAEMLMRMYLRWAERQGFQTVLYDYQPGEEAGIKSATFAVNGEYAFGLLDQRNRRAPPGAHLALRSGQAPAHVVRQRLCFAGNRRQHRSHHQAGRPSHRHLPLQRQGRTAREHHRFRRAHHAHSHRPGRQLPERALAAQEQRTRDEHAALEALRIRNGEEARGHEARSKTPSSTSISDRRFAPTSCSRIA